MAIYARLPKDQDTMCGRSALTSSPGRLYYTRVLCLGLLRLASLPLLEPVKFRWHPFPQAIDQPILYLNYCHAAPSVGIAMFIRDFISPCMMSCLECCLCSVKQLRSLDVAFSALCVFIVPAFCTVLILKHSYVVLDERNPSPASVQCSVVFALSC